MSRVLYIVLLIGAGAFYLMYVDSLSFILLAALIILPFFMLAQLVISAAMFKCSVVSEEITVFKGESGDAAILLENRSPFPMPNTRLLIKTVWEPGGAVKYSRVSVPVPAFHTQTVTFGIGSEHCGAAHVSVQYIRLTDIMGLFGIKRFRKKLSCSFYVIPRVNSSVSEEASALVKEARSLALTEGADVKNTETAGDICGFREFIPGDRLSSIHYKLTARFGKDIVKQFGSDGRLRFLLSADLSGDSDSRDAALERLLSMAYFLYPEVSDVYAAVPGDMEEADICTEGICGVRYGGEAHYAALGRVLCKMNIPAEGTAADSGGLSVMRI